MIFTTVPLNVLSNLHEEELYSILTVHEREDAIISVQRVDSGTFGKRGDELSSASSSEGRKVGGTEIVGGLTFFSWVENNLTESSINNKINLHPRRGIKYN